MRDLRFSTYVMIGLVVTLVVIPGGLASALGKVEADFTFHPGNPAVGQSVQFTDTSTTDEGTIVDWAWEFDDGEFSIQQNPTHVFISEGRYSVKLTVTTSTGESADERHDVEVSEALGEPTASFSFSPAEPVAGQLVQFTDTSTGGAITDWEWGFDDGGTSSAQNPTHRFAEEGSYEVQLTVTNAGGDSDAREEIEVSASEEEPQANFSWSPAEPVVGQTVRFTDTSGGGTANSWEWDFDDGDSSSAQNPTHAFSEDGSYEVRLTASNSAGSSDQANEVEVSANEDEPEASFSFSPADPVVGQAVKFTDTSGGGQADSWEWDFDDGDSSSAQNPTHSFGEEGSYEVNLTVTNSTGHSDAIEEVTVSLDESEPEANFSFSPAEPVVGQAVRFTDNSGGGQPDSWQWDFDDGDSSSAQNPTHAFGEEGSYEVKLTVTNSAGDTDDVKEVTVFVNETAPEASFSFTPAQPVEGQAVRFTDQSTGDAADYWEWKFGDGGTSNEQDPAHVYDDPGSYTVELRVGNSVGADSTTRAIKIFEDTDINPPEGDLEVTYFVPSASHAAGAQGSFWLTDVEINNSGDDWATYKLVWLPRNTDNSFPTYSEPFELAPGSVHRIEDPVNSIFDINKGYGALGVVSDSEDLFLFSRTYNEADTGTFGTAVPGVAENDLIQGNTRKRLLYCAQNDDFRTNLAFQNGTDSYLTVKWEHYLADGTLSKSGEVELKPWGNKQLNEVFTYAAPVEAAYIDVWTDTPGGKFMVFSSVVDNGTSDGTVVQPQW